MSNSSGIKMKLLIRNLDRSTTVKQLTTMFQEFGTVQSCDIVMDPSNGKSKGFGFVEMSTGSEAKAAMVNLNNKTVGSNKIRVKKAENKSA